MGLNSKFVDSTRRPTGWRGFLGEGVMDDGGEIEHLELASVPPERTSDIELARLIGRVLTNAARTLNIPHHKDMGLEALCRAIAERAQGGRLDPLSYRVAWMMLTEGPRSRTGSAGPRVGSSRGDSAMSL